MIVSGFYCPYCGYQAKQCAPIEFDEYATITFKCEYCDRFIAVSI